MGDVISLLRAKRARPRRPRSFTTGHIASLLPFALGQSVQSRKGRDQGLCALPRHRQAVERIEQDGCITTGALALARCEITDAGDGQSGGAGDIGIAQTELPKFNYAEGPRAHGTDPTEFRQSSQRNSVTIFRPNRRMKTIGDRIRAVREEKGISRADLARAAGLAYSTLADLENGNSASTTALHKIAEFLGIRARWFETGRGSRDQLVATFEDTNWVAVEDVTRVGEAANENLRVEDRVKFRIEQLQTRGLRADRLLLMQATDRSMEPSFREGDTLLIDTSDTHPQDDQVFLVAVGQTAQIRRLLRIGASWCLSADNAALPEGRKPVPLETLPDTRIIGRVRWVGGWRD